MLILLTDTHLGLPGTFVHGLSPEARLEAAVPIINKAHPDAKAILVMGDIAEYGEAEAYRRYREIAEGFSAPVHTMLGNHDSRSRARKELPDLADDGNGFVQFTLRLANAYCVCLDTHEPKRVSGTLCDQRLDWLDQALAAAPDGVPVLLFQHHHPFRSGLTGMDRIALDNPDAEWEVLKARGLPAMLFVGHVHRPISGYWRGIPVHAQRGTNHQVGWDVGASTRRSLMFTKEGPEYAIVQADRESVIVLARNYEDEDLEIVRG